MKHLTRQELMLYTDKRGLSPMERQKFNQHLQTCEKCCSLLTQLQRKKKNMSQANLSQCGDCFSHLLSYIDGVLDYQKTEQIKQHLQECGSCEALYVKLTDYPDWEKIAESVNEIPTQVKTTIETAVAQALTTQRLKQQVKQTR
ncbi:MAG: zf-HC2 domain-containing protein, partial [Calditrichales bacterium]|nr:zf-HC2 domain-containing protein [Calditrichales bacterium]